MSRKMHARLCLVGWGTRTRITHHRRTSVIRRSEDRGPEVGIRGPQQLLQCPRALVPCPCDVQQQQQQQQLNVHVHFRCVCRIPYCTCDTSFRRNPTGPVYSSPICNRRPNPSSRPHLFICLLSGAQGGSRPCSVFSVATQSLCVF